MALVSFQDLPNTTTPLNASNLNNNFNFLCNQITVTCADITITTEADQRREDIPVNTLVASVGDKLTLNTANNKHEIKIGSGVSYVSVSCGCTFNQKTSGMTYQTLVILKNGSQYGKWANSKGSYSPSIYMYTNLADVLIPVQENDAISIAMFNRIAGTVEINNVYLSVRVVK